MVLNIPSLAERMQNMMNGEKNKKEKTIFDEIQKKYQDIFIKLLIKSHKLGNWRIKQNEKSYNCGFCQKEIYDWNHMQDCDFIIINTKKEHHLRYNLGYYVLAYNANKKEERKQKFV